MKETRVSSTFVISDNPFHVLEIQCFDVSLLFSAAVSEENGEVYQDNRLSFCHFSKIQCH